MKSNVYRSAAQVTVFSAVEKTLSFFYRIILSRVLGAEGVGIYQICLTVFAVLLTAASSGIPVTVSRLIAKQRATGTTHGKHAVVTAGVVCTMIFTVPMALIAFFGRNMFGFLFPDESCVKIFIILLPGLILTSIYAVMRGTFWGNKQFLPYSLIELAEDSVMVIVGCILISFSKSPAHGAALATIAVLISYVFSFLVSVFWYLYRGGRFVNPKKQIKPLLGASMPITAMRTSTSLLNSVVAMFLPAFLMATCGYSDSEAIALYGVALGMSIPILFTPNSLIGSIAVVVAPEMSENFYAGREEKLKRDVERTLKASVLIATLLIPVFFTLGEDMGVFLYNNVLSGQLIRKFCFMMLPMCLSMISTTVLNSMNYEVKTLVYFFVGALSMLVCIFTLTPVIGINGYMVGQSLSFTVTAALNLRLLRKLCPEVNYFGYTLRSVIICVTSCLFGWLTVRLFGDIDNIFLRLAINGILVCGFAGGMFYAMEMFSVAPLGKLFAKKR